MIYIAICDDEKKTLEVLNSRICKFIEKNNIGASITTYSNSELLKYDIEEKKHYDLILSDIEMPNIDGMELASYIKKHLPDVLIIFITSYLKYAIDAFELSVFRYVPKKMISSRLDNALQDAMKIIRMQDEDYYIIQTFNRTEKLSYKRILYIQREGKNSVFVLNDSSTAKIRKSLSSVYNELSKDDFMYIERGTIVNLSHIESVTDVALRLDNGTILHPSHTKFEDIKLRLSLFWRKQI